MGKKLHWNRKLNNRSIKRIFSVVLAFVLCFSMFSNSVLTARAQGKYTRTKFAFDFSAYASSWSDTFKETFASADFQYLYAFHFHDQYSFDFFSGIGSAWKFPHIMVGNTSARSYYVNTEAYYFLFTTSPLVANYQYDTDVPVVTLGFSDSNPNKAFCVYIKGSSAVVYNGWSTYGETSLPDFGLRMVHGSAPNDIIKYTYFNPYYCDVMSNADICQYNNSSEVLWQKCLSDDVLTTFKNTSTGTDSGSGSSGSGSSGGTLVETGDLVEYDDTLGSLFHNISVIAQRIVNLPYYIAQSVADRLGLGSLFDRVVNKLSDINEDIYDAVSPLAENWAQLPLEIGSALGTNEFFASVLENWVSLGTDLATLPYEIAVEIGKDATLGDILEHVTDIPLDIGHQIGQKLEDFGLDWIVDIPLDIGHQVGQKLEDFGLDWIVRIPLDIGTEIGRVLEDTHVSDIPQKIEDSVSEISENMKKDTSDILLALFVPGAGVLDSYVSDLKARFPFIESAHSNMQYLVDSLGLIDHSKSPVIVFPFSKSALSAYGVGDVTVDFSWFAPYRSQVLAVESAFMYGLFAVRQFFGVKNMLNATDSSVRIVARG